MTGKWTSILKQSGEPDLGAALVRLARFAAASHLQRMRHDAENPATAERHGLAASPVAPDSMTQEVRP
jgi:hypothetical protein